MHSISCTIFFILLTFANGYSQQPSDKIPVPTCDYSELYRKAGWDIPGIKGAKTKDGRMAVPGKPGVFRTELEPASRTSTIHTFRCSREHPGRLEIEDIDIGIGSLSTFDVGGQIFAYGLTYGVRVVENGQPMDIAAEWSLKFYDLDGSGRFTIIRGERGRFVPEFFPNWVKGGADTNTKQDGGSPVAPRN
jgi:hypothetical protein